MDKFLAIVVLIVFVWLAVPRIVQGQWLAPTAIPPDSWVTQSPYDAGNAEAAFGASEQNAEAAALPPEGYGWFHFDFWNHPTPTGVPATTNDLNLRL